MLNAIFLLSSVVATGFCIRRTGLFSPASLSATFTLISMVLFLAVSWFPDLSGTGGLSFDVGHYDDVASIVIGIYGIFIVLTALAVRRLSRPSNAVHQVATIQFVRSFAARLVAPFAVGLAIVTVIDVAVLAAVGLDNSTAETVVTALGGPISAAAACAITFGLETKSRAYVLLLPVLAIHFALMLITYSRWTAVVCALIAILIANRRLTDKKSALSIGLIAMAILTVWMDLFALQGRVDRGRGADMGLVVQHLTEITIDRDTLLGLVINVFQGPLALAETLQIRNSPYDWTYAVLSFSPFPSFIDNWKQIEPLANRVNIFTPYTAFGELFHFGAPYMVLFAAIYAICIRTLTRVYVSVGFEVGFLITSPAIYPLLALHQYPVRNCLRLFIYTTIFSYLLSRGIDRRLQASGQDDVSRTQHPAAVGLVACDEEDSGAHD